MKLFRFLFFFNILILSIFILSCSDTNGVENNYCNNSCKSWQKCDFNNICILKSGFCNTTDNCNNNEICNEEHKCKENIIVNCNSNTQCKSYEVCNNNHKCVMENNSCTQNTCDFSEICNEDTLKCELITGKCQSDSDCKEGFSCKSKYCNNNDVTYTTIQNLQIDNSLINKKVQTIGIVTAIALSQKRQPKGLYIQFGEEKHSGLYVYFIVAGETSIKVGDRIKVAGILDRDIGHARIRTRIEDIKLIKNGEMSYSPIEVDYFNALEDYESMLISVKLDGRFNLRDIEPEHWVFIKQTDSNFKIYVKDTISYLNHLSLVMKLESLVGILDNFNGLGRVLPRSEDDIIVYFPICEEGCLEWEECLDRDYCAILTGRCMADTDCKNEYSICNRDSHYCKEPSILDNADIDKWTNGKPVGYLIGSALKVTKEDNRVENSNFSAKIERFESLKTNNDSIEFLSPAVSVSYNNNYEISLFILDDSYGRNAGIDAKIYYKAYDVYDNIIGSGIAGDNDFTKNVNNWINLKYVTGFLDKGEIWRGPLENLSYIRFGIRLYKEHHLDGTLGSGNGYLYIDNLSLKKVN